MGTKTWFRGAALAASGVAAMAGLRWTAPSADAACCYFAAQEKDINQPGQKAFITWDKQGKVEAFTVQPKFEGNAIDFGMVIPTPSQPKLDEMPRDFFKDLAIYTILMPLPQPIYVSLGKIPPPRDGAVPCAEAGADDAIAKRGDAGHGVKVLESGVVGSLDYKVIEAERADGLFAWLKENNYVYSGDQGTLDFYIKKKWFFTVMKIDPKQMKKDEKGNYAGEVTPTRFTFASNECVYPLKITQISVKDKTDALFYVQAADQMDLKGDLSWKHSYRVMWLTYMLGCSANQEQQQELTERNAWVQDKMKKDPRYETTKLEWSRKLGDEDMAVLEEPLRNYAQMGGGTMPAGDKVITQEEFLKAVWDAYEKSDGPKDDKYAKQQLKDLETMYSPSKGSIVKVANPNGSFTGTPWVWYPNREAPDEDVKGLSRLKGHLQKDQWVTKFRKVLRNDEMTDDLLLEAVATGKEEEYVRIMPTSPP